MLLWFQHAPIAYVMSSPKITGLAKATITLLRIYPVKSCAGHELQLAALEDRGLAMDRLWLVVDGRGRFISQRRCPKMALITPSLPTSKDEVSTYVRGQGATIIRCSLK